MDGYYGEETYKIVNLFKDTYGLINEGENKGVVDNQVWQYLFGGLSGELKYNPDEYSELVRIAQIRLKDLGYDVEATGYFDEKMLIAVNEYKEANKLGNTGDWEGVIGAQTWSVLFSSDAVKKVAKKVEKEIKGTDQPIAGQDSNSVKGSKYEMIERLKKDTSLGLSKSKKDAIIDMATVLLDEGYEPEFIAGILGNIIHEGTPGRFESSNYKSNPEKKPGYLKYMDANHDYRNKFSGKTLTEVGIAETYSLLKQLEKGGYEGKFGLGSIQWTGGRTMTLIETYIELYGEDYYPTAAECRVAENRLLLKEMKGAYNKSVYQNWKSQYSGCDGAEAAYGAGSVVCKKYEIPRDADTKAIERGNDSKKIYNIMMGK